MTCYFLARTSYSFRSVGWNGTDKEVNSHLVGSRYTIEMEREGYTLFPPKFSLQEGKKAINLLTHVLMSYIDIIQSIFYI